ncbi:MAG TPA: RNA methyltransferase [Clostridiales bacterium]|nr:RNA methyltransferase [Clostridiales bacterium]
MKEELITSRNNKLVKMLKGVKRKKDRDRLNLFMVEGKKSIEEAMASRFDIRYMLYTPSIPPEFVQRMKSFCSEKGVRLIRTTDEVLESMCDTVSPQGVIGFVQKPEYSIDYIIAQDNVCLLIGENIQDPGNVGTLIRTADAAGLQAVILSLDSADPFSPKVVRSTMGSIFHIPVICQQNLVGVIDTLYGAGYQIIATKIEKDNYVWGFDFSRRCALVFGNEGSGITDEISGRCTHSVSIPLLGKAQSLNVSVAAGIVVYELVRQRMGILP